MGNGIAHVCALAGLDVHLLDAKPEAVAAALATIGKNLDRQVTKGAITAEARTDAVARITALSDYDGLAPCDIVIEAATEREEVKRAIFTRAIAQFAPTASWPPTRRRSPSPGSQPPPTGRAASSACTSSTRCR